MLGARGEKYGCENIEVNCLFLARLVLIPARLFLIPACLFLFLACLLLFLACLFVSLRWILYCGDMKRIGILSDTHGYWDDRYAKYFAECDEIWHAGDVGSEELLDRLSAVATVRAVWGNIDGQPVRLRTGQHQRFVVEGVDVWITHIGGYPGRYAREVVPEIYRRPPRLFVAGHSHIAKVMYDKTLDCLHINPGAAGRYGFHKVRTLVRLVIDDGVMRDLEIIELKDN